MMQTKTLRIGDNLQEEISYNSHFIPLAVCIDNFNDYFRREWGCHWHDEFEFGIVRKGAVEFTIYDGQEHFAKELRQGDGIFIGSGCLHSARGIEPDTVIAEFVLPTNFFDINIFENMFRHNVRPMMESGITNIVLDAADTNDQPLLSGIEELCSITEQEAWHELHFVETACKVWRLLLVRALQEEKVNTACVNKVQEQRVKKILSYIHAHFGKHISIDDMAKSAAVSRTECFRCFQAVLGKSPVAYLTEYRLSMATTMLADSERTLADISDSCGFNSPSYFGRLFREQCGTTPKKYRERLRRETGA